MEAAADIDGMVAGLNAWAKLHAHEIGSAALRSIHALKGRVVSAVKGMRRPQPTPPVQLTLDFGAPAPEPPVRARLAPERVSVPKPTEESDRAAFQRLAGLGAPERALFALISNLGLSASAHEIGVEPAVVLVWIRAEAVGLYHADIVQRVAGDKAHTRRGVRATGAVDPRRDRFRELARLGHSTRRMASILGVSRSTIMRWAVQDAERVG